MAHLGEPATLRGTRLGSCILEEPLGAGGMGTVYLAQQERPHRRVAVKVLHPHLAADPAAWEIFLERFRREADAAAALDHANIVPIFEFGEDGGVVYLVMPYLSDGSLAALIDREGPLSLELTARFLDHAAAALDYAHDHGIVHRDVKPSNLLLHPDGRLVLADFGIARPILPIEPLPPQPGGIVTPRLQPEHADLTQLGNAMGTPEYMAPEQVRGEPVSPATDIYALGIVAYVMLAGHSPFAGEDLATVLTSQLLAPPQPLRPMRPEIPARVEEAIFGALAKEPADRPASARAFAQAFRQAARSRSLASVLARSQPVVAAGWGLGRGVPSVRLPLTSGTRPIARSAAPVAEAPVAEAPVALALVPPSDPPGWSADGPDAPTIFDAPAPPLVPAVPWPLPPKGGGEPRSPRPRRWTIVAGIAALLVAVMLGVVAANLAMSFGGALAQLGGSGAAGTPNTSPQPTALPSPTASLFPSNWLSVTPDSISLTCHRGSRSTTVQLSNLGSQSIQWHSSVPKVDGTQEVALSPNSGTIKAGGTVKIAVTNTSQLVGHQDQIQFIPSDPQAGEPAIVNFTTSPCP